MSGRPAVGWRTAAAAAAAAAAGLLAPLPFAEAQPKKDKATDKAPDRKTCIQSFEAAQTSRRAGKLADAVQHLAVCSHEKCPDMTRRPCTQWKSEWANAAPKLSIEIVDAGGAPLANAQILIDGQAEKRSTLRDLRLDPGPHTVVATVDGRGEQRATVTLVEGGSATARLVFPDAPSAGSASSASSLSTTTEAPRPSRLSTAPTATFVLGALGVVGLATFAIAGTSGRSDQNDLKTGCAPRCNPADKDAAQRKFIIADVGLLVGVASLGIASYLFFRTPTQASSGARLPIRFDLQTDRTGATGVLGGSF